MTLLQLYVDPIIYKQWNKCDKIHSWISLRDGDLAYGLKFPERFLEISSRDLTLLSILVSLRPDYQSIGVLLFCIHKADCLASSSPVLCLVT